MTLYSLFDFFNPSSKITAEKVLETHNLTPKRICLKTLHSNSLRAINFGNAKWALFIPFDNSIKDMFEEETKLKIYPTKKGAFWCPIEEEKDYTKALEFKEKYDDNVFLRDCLDISIALSEHLDNNGGRTYLGELEYQAKYQTCKKSLRKLSDALCEFINNTPFYNECTHICAIPSSNPSKLNLPQKLARMVANTIDITNCSEIIQWSNDKESLKELHYEEKWDTLSQVGVDIEDPSEIKNVILLDDLYQSGITMQFVAMKLKEAGVNKVYGLSLVKSRKDTDNK